MKFVNLFLLAGIATAICSCTTENLGEDVLQASQKTADDSQIVCIDGTLHFPTAESCLNTLSSLTSGEALAAFEQRYGFFSWRSLTEKMLDELIECETLEDYRSILETCEGYLKEEDGRLMPVVSSVGYASIADMNGVFYVGNVKHTVEGEKIIVETTDPETRAVDIEEIEYICPVLSGMDMRGSTQQKYTDNRYQSGKYKIFARTNVIRNTAVEQINGKKMTISKFFCQVHVSGQKKKTLIGWNTYKDHFYVENLHYEIKAGWITFGWNSYKNSSSYVSSGRVKNFYVTEPIGDKAFTGPDAILMPTEFQCIVHRARSGSIGNCGVLTNVVDRQKCKTFKGVDIKQCK